jgi:hypothetical protein
MANARASTVSNLGLDQRTCATRSIVDVWVLPDDSDRAFHTELSLFAAVLGAQDAGEDVDAGSLVDQLLLDAAR